MRERLAHDQNPPKSTGNAATDWRFSSLSASLLPATPLQSSFARTNIELSRAIFTAAAPSLRDDIIGSLRGNGRAARIRLDKVFLQLLGQLMPPLLGELWSLDPRPLTVSSSVSRRPGRFSMTAFRSGAGSL